MLVAAMGFEVLYGGTAASAQGKQDAASGPGEGGGLIMPLSIPLLAGPGATLTVITMVSSRPDGNINALIGTAVVALTIFVSFRFLGAVLAR